MFCSGKNIGPLLALDINFIESDKSPRPKFLGFIFVGSKRILSSLRTLGESPTIVAPTCSYFSREPFLFKAGVFPLFVNGPLIDSEIY